MKIVEALGSHKPIFDVSDTVRRLVRSVPGKYLAGLGSIVITTSSALASRDRRQVVHQRQGKLRVGEACGAYYQPWQGQPARIELLVDNMLAGWPRWVFRFAFFRDAVIGATLYHELGHHIHKTQRPDRKEKEITAEKWRWHLAGNHNEQCHPRLRLLQRVLYKVLRRVAPPAA